MSEIQYRLTYKTRGNSSPQGKQKVYFCCHPKDFARFFEKISDEILQEQNCAVWYAKDANTPRDEDFLNDLKEMQLFVMPVTTALLTTHNHAVEIEFPFAMENHIPVLPLMQEGGLEELFNKKCGDLQFLDPHKQDPTAIPYGEKFKKYLSSVLIGDELAEKIRDAFDAYVFLSYRKKDRKHARELMRLIHKNDFCRDIAIWYDEFLTPGENFNDAIRKALDKSGLFVLAVTPNLVNEKNYVMTVEYPMAKDAGKPILPAEMVKTPKWRLKWKYKDIPTPTNAHDDTALNATLAEAIKNLAIRENDTSPEHNFFIGLAYLGGIDVEVDHPRATALITSAAEAGLIEAVDKLIDMYENGEGVERNYHTAVAWRERKIVLQEKAYRASPDDDALHSLFWSAIECGDAYKALGKPPAAREKYAQGEKLIEESGRQEQNKNIRRDLSVSYERLGDVCQSVGDPTGARAYYEKGLTIAEELARETNMVKSRRDLSISYDNLGDVCQSVGDPTGARAYYEKGLAIAEELARETNTVESRRDLSISYDNLGDVCQSVGEPDGARAYYEKGLTIREELARETNTVES
ncbi:MAG: tetratricopeptide repeat protein, partial [Clostridia bacterium]|nr:tetratricopeptide repeat protein [Clostridia bacterium]